MVQIVAVITTIAFIGLVPVIILTSIGIGPFAGDGNSAQADLIAEAQDRVDATPKDPDAWEDLAAAYAADQDFEQAIEAAQMAVDLDKGAWDRVQNLVSIEIAAGQNAEAITALQSYTTRDGANAEAFLQLGQLAEQAGRVDLARLSYQRFLMLEPDDPSAPAVQDRLDQLANGGVTTTP